MSLSTSSKDPNIQQLFTNQLNPVYERFCQAERVKNPVGMRNALTEIQETLGVINVLDARLDFKKFMEDLSGRVTVVAANPAPPTDPLAPKGIENAGANCWANALIHLIARSPSMLAKLQSSRDPRITQIAQLIDQHLQGKAVDSQAFRHALIGLQEDDDIETIPQSASEQIDVMKAYQRLASALGKTLPFDRVREHRLGTASYSEPMRPENEQTEIVLMMQNGISFDQMMRDFFENQLDLENEWEVKTFQTSPEDLVIQAKRFSLDLFGRATKISSPILGIPDRFTPPSKDGADYEFSSCILHIGDSPDRGHYVFLEKRGSTYYHINDESVFRWENKKWVLVEGFTVKNPANNPNLGQTPTAMMQQAYLFQYTKAAAQQDSTQSGGASSVPVANASENLEQDWVKIDASPQPSKSIGERFFSLFSSIFKS